MVTASVVGFALLQHEPEPRAEAVEAVGGVTSVVEDVRASTDSGRPDREPVIRTPALPVPPAAGKDAGDDPVTIAFAGDIHAEGGAGEALRSGLQTIGPALDSADLTIANLEMAITTRGVPAEKQYTFRSSPSSLSALRDAGVDVVTMANNHGLDYGLDGLRDSLSAARSTRLPVVGIGLDEDAAYAPHVVDIRGQRIAVLGATQVLDDQLAESWTARRGRPGLASAKREQRLLAEVSRVRTQADTVVVYLHWGRELDACPLPQQQSLAGKLVRAGADIVVGAHAHVLLGGGYLQGAYVDYGLGNFIFNTKGGEGARSGVLTLTVSGRTVTNPQWQPALIREGMPYLLSGPAAEQARDDKLRRRDCTGLRPSA